MKSWNCLEGTIYNQFALHLAWVYPQAQVSIAMPLKLMLVLRHHFLSQCWNWKLRISHNLTKGKVSLKVGAQNLLATGEVSDRAIFLTSSHCSSLPLLLQLLHTAPLSELIFMPTVVGIIIVLVRNRWQADAAALLAAKSLFLGNRFQENASARRSENVRGE